MIYLDTSALVKLIFTEPETAALARWLEERPDTPKVSSALAAVELRRACRRTGAAAIPAAEQLLRGLDAVPLTADVLEQAAAVDPPTLRSLDALHLATALGVAEFLSAFVAYDGRLRVAAERAGLPVASPA